METIEKQKTFRHCLLYYLDCSYRQYEAIKYKYFLGWSEKANREKRIVKNVTDLVGNDYLNNWFDDQWLYYVECDIAYYYGKALREGVFDQSDIELMIEIAAEQINHIYPKVLLSKIRRELKFQN